MASEGPKAAKIVDEKTYNVGNKMPRHGRWTASVALAPAAVLSIGIMLVSDQDFKI